MNKKTKILHIVSGLPRGGLEKIVCDIATGINHNRFEVQVCCLAFKGELVEWFEQAGVTIHFFHFHNRMSFLGSFRNCIELIKLSGLIRKEKIDIVHGHEYFPALMARLASILSGRKLVIVTLHTKMDNLGRIHHFINRLVAGITSVITTVSKASMRYSMAADRISQSKYKIIYNGIEPIEFPEISGIELQRVRHQFQISQDNFVMGTIGGLTFRKGHDVTIKAMPAILEKISSARLVIIGSPILKEPGLLSELEALCEKLGVRKAIHFAGSLPNARQYLHLFDVFIMSSVVEGFGLALAEAMFHERLCIASDLDVFREIMEEYKEGFYYKKGRHEELADQVISVWQMSDADKKRITGNAKQKIMTNFTKQKMVLAYQNLYDELIHSNL